MIEVSDVHEEGSETAFPARSVRRWWALALTAAIVVAGAAGYAVANVNGLLHPVVCMPAAPAEPVVLAGDGAVTGKATFTYVTGGQYAANISIALDHPGPRGEPDRKSVV